jgi:hypothetical protein
LLVENYSTLDTLIWPLGRRRNILITFLRDSVMLFFFFLTWARFFGIFPT